MSSSPCLAPASQDSTITSSGLFTPSHRRCLAVSRGSRESRTSDTKRKTVLWLFNPVIIMWQDFRSICTRAWVQSRHKAKPESFMGWTPPLLSLRNWAHPSAHIMQDRRERYKESPIYQFFILLRVGTGADTHKDPFQRGIIYHTTEIHKRQIIPEIMAAPLTCSRLKGGCN